MKTTSKKTVPKTAALRKKAAPKKAAPKDAAPPKPRPVIHATQLTPIHKRLAATPTVVLLPGDGIGPEITDATLRVIDSCGGKVHFEPHLAGVTALEKLGDPLPEVTLDSIKKHRVALKGPLGTPIGEGFRSVNVALRQTFDLYANVRPVKTIRGVPSHFDKVDLIVVRENTEDIYAGVEHFIDPKRSAAESICIITRAGSERIIEYAFEYARTHGRKRVTAVHKANILKTTNGLFVEVGRLLSKKYPDITYDESIVDATCMKLVVAPERFDVIVTMNLFGDILSDLTAGLVGGLGLAPAANLGQDCAIFEAVHGTAPDIAGKGIANPSALMLSAAMMLEHLDQREAGDRLRAAVIAALGRAELRTGDLRGRGNTATFTTGVIEAMR